MCRSLILSISRFAEYTHGSHAHTLSHTDSINDVFPSSPYFQILASYFQSHNIALYIRINVLNYIYFSVGFLKHSVLIDQFNKAKDTSRQRPYNRRTARIPERMITAAEKKTRTRE